MIPVRVVASEFATPAASRAANHLGRLVREARLARRMPQAELAVRAKTSKLTIIRIERGAVETALGTWLRVLEQLGLLGQVMALNDPIARALVEQGPRRRARRPAKVDLDF